MMVQESVNTVNHEDMRKLREEYDTLAKDYNLIKKERLQIENVLQDERREFEENKKRIRTMEEDLGDKEKTIADLEKRR